MRVCMREKCDFFNWTVALKTDKIPNFLLFIFSLKSFDQNVMISNKSKEENLFNQNKRKFQANKVYALPIRKETVRLY